MTREQAKDAIPWEMFKFDMLLLQKRVNTVELLALELRRLFLMNASELDQVAETVCGPLGDAERGGVRARMVELWDA